MTRWRFLISFCACLTLLAVAGPEGASAARPLPTSLPSMERAMPVITPEGWAALRLGATPKALNRQRVMLDAEEAPLARRVNFVIGCSGSVYEPKEIALSCADGKVRFETDGRWEEWGPARASTHGTLSFPDCSPKTPLIACNHYVEDEAVVHLWRPVYCPNVRHWQFSRLTVKDLVGSGPEGFAKPIPYPCERFKPEPIHLLGASAARNYMRSVMSRFSYEARAGGSITCVRRLSSTRRTCRMGWVIGDSGFGGQGEIWLTFKRHEKQAHFSYRLTLIDEYCLYVTHEGDCTKKRSDSGLVPGQQRSLERRARGDLEMQPRRHARSSYWSECTPPASYQASILVHEVDCARARSDIERLYEKGQEQRHGNAPYVKVNGFECFLNPRYGNPEDGPPPVRPVTCRRADKVIKAAMP